MKKLFSILFFFTAVAVGLNFAGHQSLNGIGSDNYRDTTIFTAPQTGVYFINGQLTLPSGSSVQANVSKNGSTIYTGVTANKGFAIKAMRLVTNDVISVRLRSSSAVDKALNAVRGEVYYGNTF